MNERNGKPNVPLWYQYTLTIPESSAYFNIGEKNIRKLVSNNPDADYILRVGKKVLIKRRLFEAFIDETESV